MLLGGMWLRSFFSKLTMHDAILKTLKQHLHLINFNQFQLPLSLNAEKILKYPSSNNV